MIISAHGAMYDQNDNTFVFSPSAHGKSVPGSAQTIEPVLIGPGIFQAHS